MDAIERAQATENTRRAAWQAALVDGHTLVGSDKQIEWARSIRAGIAGELAVLERGVKPEMADQFAGLVTEILGEPSATRWIDDRHLDAKALLRRAMAA